MDVNIVNRAKKLISSNDINAEEIIKKIESARISLEKKLKSAQCEYQKYSELKKEFAERLRIFEKRKDKETEKYKYEAKLILNKIRAQAADLMTDIKLTSKNGLDVSAEKRRAIYSKIHKIENIADPVDNIVKNDEDYSFKAGDNVLVLGINKEGIVISAESENNILVQVENMRLNLSEKKLKIIKNSNKNKKS
jgi:DNA mismatch repair protein MutS2